MRTFFAHQRLFSASALLLSSACLGRGCWGDPKDTALDTGPITVDSDADTDGDTDVDDTEAEHPGVHGTIEGHVSVELFTYDESGDLVMVDWAESCFGDVFPYGSIFVAAYETDEKTGAETYFAEDLIADPSVDGTLNVYSLTVDTDQADEVYVYAALDKWSDRVIEPVDPIGNYAEPIALVGGATVSDVDIDIVTQYWCGYGGNGTPCPDCPPSWGNCYRWDGTQWVYDVDLCGSGGGCGDGGTVTVGGDLLVDVPYNGTGNDVGTFLMYPGTQQVWWVTPDLAVTGGPDGAAGLWGYTYCRNAGTYAARGVWDDNQNGLYDPSDTWGQPVDADDNPVGAVTFGDADQDLTMLIPVAGSDIDVVPFVRLTGTITYEGGMGALVAKYPAVELWVACLKYDPNADIDTDSLQEDSYDWQFFGPEELAGLEAVDYRLMAPANTRVFLWAYADTDADGMLNEPFDPTASVLGGERGEYVTGTTNASGLDMVLGPLEE